MDSIAIVGGATLNGEIPISGAKNSAIKLMVASLLTDEPLRLTNMPRLADTRFLGKLMRHLGTRIEERDGEAGPETLLHTPEILSHFAPYEWSARCGPVSTSWAPWSPATARPRSPCRAAAPSGPGPLTCT